MSTTTRMRDVKLISIGNSKGIRIPKPLLQKYHLSGMLLLEETENGILLRKKNEQKLSWEDTYKAMGQADEDWSDFDCTLLDGLNDECNTKEI